MKKALSIVSSVALSMALLTPGTALAQTVAKLSAAKTNAGLTAKALATPQAKKAAQTGLLRENTRQANPLTKGLKSAKTGTPFLKSKKGPAKVMAADAELPEIYGSVVYNNGFQYGATEPGLYKVNKASTDMIVEGPSAGYGGIGLDGYYYCFNYSKNGGPTYEIYDINSGNEIVSKTGSFDKLFPAGLAQDPKTGNVYGLGYNSNGDAFQLSKVTLNPNGTIVVDPVAEVDGEWNSMACDAQGQLYAISVETVEVGNSYVAVGSTLNKIDKTTGAVTVIGDTGKLPQYLSSAVIDPKSGRMFWNLCPDDEMGYLCEVNLSTGVATELFNYMYDDEIMGMYIPAPEAENNAPAAVTNLAANFADGSLEGTITFTAPETLYDGTVGEGSLTYTVACEGQADVTGTTTYGAQVSVPYSVAKPGTYDITVSVANENGVSPKSSLSVYIGKGLAIVPPYSNALSTEEDLELFTIVDANSDGRTWTISGGSVRVQYNSSMAMDDWLISPALKLEAGKMYKFTCQTKGQSASYVEKIEVKFGNAATAAAMTNEVVAPTDVTSTAYSEIAGAISPSETGTYYVGIHGISDADQYYLYVKDFSVGAAESAAAPAAVTDLSVTRDVTGALEATVKFTAPSKSIGGAALEGNVNVELTRDGEVIYSSSVAPGSNVEVVDNVPVDGTYEYTVVASNEDGSSFPATVSTYVGVGVPAVPVDVNMTEEGNTGVVTVSWSPVTTDEEGYAINADQVYYYLAINTIFGWLPMTDPTYDTSITVQAVPEGEQDFVQYALFAETAGGYNGALTPLLAVGTPYNGIEESFADGEVHYAWATGYSSNASWSLYTDEDFTDISSCDGDNGFAAMYGEYLNANSGLYTGKISFEGMSAPGITFYTYNIGGDSANEFQIFVQEAGTDEWAAVGAPIVVNDLNPGVDGWQKAMVSLEEYAGKTVQVRIQGYVKMYKYTMLDMVKIGNMLDYDLVAEAINAPAFVNSGADFNVNVVVTNDGVQAADAYSVTLYTADGESVATVECGELASGASNTVTFTCTMSVVAEEPVSYYAVVNYAADEDVENNQSETINVAPKMSKLPKVTDLAAERVEAGVKLTWSEPDLSAAPVESGEVDFEDGDSWAMEYEGWTFVDVDNSPVGGFQGTDIPGQVAGESKVSFFVFDAEELFPGNPTFEAHSGDKYLAALFRIDGGTADDWAISPLLSGDAQTISFWAKSYSSNYPEKIEMYYSMNSTDVADFVKVGAAVDPVPGDWTNYTFDVPAGAKYFAVRNCATDSFMLMLDDFTFSPAGGSSADLSIVGYDIYRDGMKINEVPVAETEYLDTEVETAIYTYVVVAVYETGVSAPSNKVEIDVQTGVKNVMGGVKVASGKGAITVAGAAGEKLTVIAADGKVVYAAEASDNEVVNVAAGVYVVRAGNKTVKVSVK